MSRKRAQQQPATGAARIAATEAPNRSRRDLAAWVIAVAALISNAPIVLVDFVFDDHPIVEDSVRVNETRLGEIWTTSYWGSPERVGEYRPVVLSSYAIERALLGPSPVHYHVVNWLLHALLAVSLLFAGRSIGLREGAAALAAGLFAVHTLHLDAIAPIVGRAELFAALAVTGGVHFWVGVRTANSFPAASLLGLGGCLALGAFSKESALAAVAVLAAVEWWVLPTRTDELHHRLAACAVVAGVVLAYLGARAWVLGGLLPEGGSSFTRIANPLVEEPIAVRLLTAAAIFGHYLRLFAWPRGLSPDYSFDSLPVIRSASDPWFIVPFAIFVAFVFGALVAIRRHPPLAVAATAFFAPYAIVANAVFPIGTMLAERLFYLPSIGACWAIGIGVEALARRVGGARFATPQALAALAAIPLVALGVASYQRANEWRNEELLFHRALQTHPRNMGMWLTLGEIAIRNGRYELGVERMSHVIDIAPDFAKAWGDRGTMLAALGRVEAARSDLRRAIELDPDNLLLLDNLASVERQLGHHGEAGVIERRAAEIRARRRVAPPSSRDD
jgi:hypothetical protein